MKAYIYEYKRYEILRKKKHKMNEIQGENGEMSFFKATLNTDIRTLKHSPFFMRY